MGFWYFLILVLGILFIVRGVWKAIGRLAFLAVGSALVILALFMFQDGSAEIIAELFNL